MKSLGSVRAACLSIALLLAGLSSAAQAVTPQLASLNGAGFILQSDGSLWSLATGKQLGSGFSSLSAGRGYYAYALKSDNSLWAVTSNSGALTQSAGSYIASSGSLAIKSDGSLWDVEQNLRIGSDSGYTAVWSFPNVAFASKADGSLWVWGSDSSGDFGDGTTSTTIAAPTTVPKLVGSGFAQLWTNGGAYFGLKSDGSLWAWGYNSLGQLGTGAPVSCNPTNSALKCVATATQIGSDIVQVSPGDNFALAVKRDGGLWDWGFNDSGQLGTNSGHYSYVPQQIGDSYVAVAAGSLRQSFAIKNDGSLWAWGSNMGGSLGINDASSQYVGAPRQIGSGYAAVWNGGLFTAALKTDGSVWAWGTMVPGRSSTVMAPLQVLSGGAGSGGSNDCLFAWAEKSYGQYFAGSNVSTRTLLPYSYRAYDGGNVLAVNNSDNHLYYAGPLASGVADLGAMSDWLKKAACQ